MNVHRLFALLSLTWVLVPAILPSAALAAPPPMINYQGRLTAAGLAFTGTGHFKVALVSADGTQTCWSHDGTSVAESAPSTFADLNVVNGLYSVRLGDSSIVGMVTPLIASSPERAFLGTVGLTLSPSGNAGFGINNPSAPLHVGKITSGGAAVRIGGDPAVNGTTLIDLGMTSQNNSTPFLQGVS